MPTRCHFLVALLFVGVASVAHAGPRAVERPLPELFFSENTALVMHVSLEGITSARLLQAIEAITPPRFKEDVNAESMQGQVAAIDMFLEPLRQMGVTSMSVVGIARTPDSANDLATYTLIPVNAGAAADEQQQLTDTLNAMAAGFGMRAEPHSGWMVIHKEPALPEDAMDMSMRDASFNDALRSNPDHDFAVAFVPTAAMVESMKQGLAEQRAEAAAEAQDEVADLDVLLDSEWYYLSMVPGADPQLYMSTRAKSPARAAEFAGAWDRALVAFKEAADKELADDLEEAKRDFAESGDEYDPADYDPAPIHAMIDTLDAAPDETRMVIDLNRGEMQTFVAGVVISVQRLMDDLFDF